MQRDRVIPLIVGVSFMVVLHLYFFAAWRFIYIQYPWPGSEHTMSTGRIEPHFANSPLALLTAAVALASLGLVVAWRFTNVKRAGTMCGAGLVGTGILLAFAFRQIRQSNLLPPGLVVLALEILIPFVLGAWMGNATRRVGRRIDDPRYP
jgi:hypothetical protein